MKQRALAANTRTHVMLGFCLAVCLFTAFLGGCIWQNELLPVRGDLSGDNHVEARAVKASPDSTSTGFVYPTGVPYSSIRYYGYGGTDSEGHSNARTYYEYAGWLARYPSHYPAENRYHIGQDIPADKDDDVYAVADGSIVYISYSRPDQSGWGEGNCAVLVEHETATGQTFFALYGHISYQSLCAFAEEQEDASGVSYPIPTSSSSLNAPVPVGAGQPFAVIGQLDTTHLHFGIRRTTASYSVSGRLLLSDWPNKDVYPSNTNGFVDPIEWITTQAPRTPAVESPTVITLAATSVAHNSAVLEGTIDGDGGALIAGRGFYWKSESDIWWKWIDVSTSSQAGFSIELTGLKPETTYSYIAYAQNCAGWGHGDASVFTTTWSCSYSISPSTKNFSSSSGSDSVSVTAASGCSWTASSNDSWINITSGSSGSGNGTVNYSVSSNSSSGSRSGSISVAGKTFSISQSGASLPDLLVADIWIDPNPPTPGGYVTIGVRVRNPSSVDIVGSFKLELYIDGTYQGRSTIYGLASSSTDTTYWRAMSWPSDTQSHVVRAVVDADAQIGESNESNNSRSESFSAEHSDTTPPSVVGTDPSDGELFAMPTDVITISFDEGIVVGSGSVLMIDLDSRVIPVSWVEASGDSFIIHLAEELDYSSGYAVGLDAGAVQDVAGNPCDEYSWAFLTRAAVPGVTGIDPATPTANPFRQWIDVVGSGFVSESQVTLRIGSSTYVIPSDRTQYVNSETLSIYVGLTDPGWWSAEVTNPDGATSNRYLFLVVE